MPFSLILSASSCNFASSMRLRGLVVESSRDSMGIIWYSCPLLFNAFCIFLSPSFRLWIGDETRSDTRILFASPNALRSSVGLWWLVLPLESFEEPLIFQVPVPHLSKLGMFAL